MTSAVLLALLPLARTAVLPLLACIAAFILAMGFFRAPVVR